MMEDIGRCRKPVQQGLSTPVAGLHPGGLDLAPVFHPFVLSVTHQDAGMAWLLWLLKSGCGTCCDANLIPLELVGADGERSPFVFRGPFCWLRILAACWGLKPLQIRRENVK
jgi:hypothetical protein